LRCHCVTSGMSADGVAVVISLGVLGEFQVLGGILLSFASSNFHFNLS
jgi:hypothetical protein